MLGGSCTATRRPADSAPVRRALARATRRAENPAMKQQHHEPGPDTGATRSERRPTGPTDQPEVEGHGLPGALELRVTPRNPEPDRVRRIHAGVGHGLPGARHPRDEGRAR